MNHYAIAGKLSDGTTTVFLDSSSAKWPYFYVNRQSVAGHENLLWEKFENAEIAAGIANGTDSKFFMGEKARNYRPVKVEVNIA